MSRKYWRASFHAAADRLGTAGGEEDPIAVARGDRGQPVGQVDRGGVGVAPDWEVRELPALTGRGFHQIVATVADLAGEEAGEPVEIALPVLVVDPGALATDDHRNRTGPTLGHPGEVHPQVTLPAFLQWVGWSAHRVPQA